MIFKRNPIAAYNRHVIRTKRVASISSTGKTASTINLSSRPFPLKQ